METFDPTREPLVETNFPVNPVGGPPAKPQPETEPSDPHLVPLENENDAQYLPENDPRRKAVEQKRGKKF